MKFETKDLALAAKELNKVLGLSPAIKIAKVTRKDLMKQLKKNVVEVASEDHLSDETWAVVHFMRGEIDGNISEEEDTSEETFDPLAYPEDEKEEETTKVEVGTLHIMKGAIGEDVDPVEKEVEDFKESFDVDLELEVKKVNKETLKQKQEKERSKNAKVRSQASDERKEYIISLIKEAKYSKNEIFTLATQKYPEWKPVTINTLLSDCMNPKYNPLKAVGLVVRNEKTKVMSFE